ncbi:UNKNOWN [Stylonychia lemnae]|uniref:VPS9 domain-containing protein n=1 Tax=Stylonychia lemnae TaxID=5949 RepID=A0A078A3L5_STYLE|nr:UNKNOWN [Stylonychia lemnae]|eukprot:CDW75334.1 UNKNOWN [Stylonychia lemnae]
MLKRELQCLGTQEIEWAYPLFNYIKAKFRQVDIQQITFKLLSDYFWAQYNNTDQSDKMKETSALRLFTQQFNNVSSPTGEKKEFMLSSPRRSFLPPEMRFSNQYEFKAGDHLSSNHHRSVKLTFKSILSDETGNDALRLSTKFNRKVLIIRDQMQQKSHPIHKIIKKFDLLFFQIYAVQIERASQKNVKESKELMNQIVKEVQNFVRIIFFATLKFYRLELKPQDLRKDLVINMITSLIMKDQTYSIIMNAILQGSSDRVRNIQKNIGKYRYKINLDKLGVSKYFQFSRTFKDLLQQDTSTMSKSQNKDPIQQLNMNVNPMIKDQKLEILDQRQLIRSKTLKKKRRRKNSYSKDTYKPFEKSIEALKEIPEINSPMKKLEFIYQVFNTLMIGEIDQFWESINVDQKKLEIDYENLNGIAIYIALKAGIPILLIDIIFIENFVSKAILNTNRAYQMTVLHSAMTFIEENLPSYYESKDKKNPLKENFTPKFVYNESVLLSPRSMGQSVLMSKLGQSFNQQSSEQTQEEYDPEKEEDMLFCMEQVSMLKNLDNQKPKQRKMSSDLEQERNNSAQSKSQLNQDRSTVELESQINQKLNLRNKNFCNIQPNAAKTIHRMLNQKLHTQSMIGNQNKTGFYNLAQSNEQMYQSSENISPQSQKLIWNLNIYSDYDRLISTYLEDSQLNCNQDEQRSKSPITSPKIFLTSHDEVRLDIIDKESNMYINEIIDQINLSSDKDTSN